MVVNNKMVLKLDQTRPEIASSIRAVFQVSYAIEAKLLKAKNFPPLNRKLNDFVKSKTTFYKWRYRKNNNTRN